MCGREGRRLEGEGKGKEEWRVTEWKDRKEGYKGYSGLSIGSYPYQYEDKCKYRYRR